MPTIVTYDLSSNYSHVSQGINNCPIACMAMVVNDTLQNVISVNGSIIIQL